MRTAPKMLKRERSSKNKRWKKEVQPGNQPIGSELQGYFSCSLSVLQTDTQTENKETQKTNNQ